MDKIIQAELKASLLQKREDLLKLVAKHDNLGDREVGDSIDIASDSAEKEIQFELNDYERIMLNDIENALNKITTGRYGKCEFCGCDVAETRLKVIPAARLCIGCQSKSEIKK
jgi:RNA polymerase-binding protein DksA